MEETIILYGRYSALTFYFIRKKKDNIIKTINSTNVIINVENERRNNNGTN